MPARKTSKQISAEFYTRDFTLYMLVITLQCSANSNIRFCSLAGNVQDLSKEKGKKGLDGGAVWRGAFDIEQKNRVLCKI